MGKELKLTDEEKEKISMSIFEYLESHKWLEKSNPDEFVMKSLPELWKKIEVEGLIKKGMTYAVFVQAANQQFHHAQLAKQFGGFWQQFK